MNLLKYGLPLLVVSLLVNCNQAASAQDLPPGPQPVESIPTEPTSQPEASGQEQEKNVVAGPLEAQRQQLYNQIQAASASGIGIKNYMMAFNYIETMAKNGESEEAIKKRMVPLVTALANQLETKKYLKTKPQRQAASQSQGSIDPSQILAPGQNIESRLKQFGGLGGNQTNDLINRIVQQKGLGDKIPAGIDSSFIKQKLKDPKVQEMIKKYRGKKGL